MPKHKGSVRASRSGAARTRADGLEVRSSGDRDGALGVVAGDPTIDADPGKLVSDHATAGDGVRDGERVLGGDPVAVVGSVAVRALDDALRGLKPTLPITLEDTIVVWNRCRPHVTGALKLDVMHNGRVIIITVLDAKGERVFSRELAP